MYIQDAGVMTCFAAGAEYVKYWDMHGLGCEFDVSSKLAVRVQTCRLH